MSKSVYFGSNAQTKLMQGIKTLADAVKLTLGPKGRNVIMEKNNEPLITNDGVTIANNINFEDKVENLGAKVIKLASTKTNNEAGDGTTTATILTEAILTNGINYINTGANPIFLRNGINKAVDFCIKELEKHVLPVKSSNEIQQIATLSSANKHIGQLIAKAYENIGLVGSIMLENSQTANTYLEIVEGARLNNGYISPYMCEEGKQQIELINPYVLVTDKLISKANEVLPIMEQVAKENASLIIVAEDVVGDALNTITINNIRKTFTCVCVKAPFYATRKTDTLADLSLILNAEFINSSLYKNLETLTLQSLGRCNKVVITKNNTTFITENLNKQNINQKLEELHKQKIGLMGYEKECIEARINMLCGKVAQIYVGANSQIELNENKLRIEDAVNATQSAIEEGIIVGGGTAFVKIIASLLNFINTLGEEEKQGAEIILKTLPTILCQIVKNAGLNPQEVLDKVMSNQNFEYGYNALTNSFVNLIEDGVIDPFKVIRSALSTSASVASTLLTTDCVIVENAR